jgi:SAM-dependent methyltransferase
MRPRQGPAAPEVAGALSSDHSGQVRSLPSGPSEAGAASSVAWHDLECGGYTADLGLWEVLAARAGGPILELGCGTGRVALHLGRRGHRLSGLDLDACLLGALKERSFGLAVDPLLGDAREFGLAGHFGLVLAPMQLMQLFGSGEERLGCLRCIALHLRVGGRAALAIVEHLPGPDADLAQPLPDLGETGGRLYSSLPIETTVDSETILIRRFRRALGPGEELREEVDEALLHQLSAARLELESARAGLAVVQRTEIPPTDAHVGSTVLLLERES